MLLNYVKTTWSVMFRKILSSEEAYVPLQSEKGRLQINTVKIIYSHMFIQED